MARLKIVKRILPLIFFIFIALPTKSFAATRSVPSQYATIQAAIDAADAGDTISIAAGTYAVSATTINVNKANLTIQGAGSSSTIINSTIGITALNVTTNNCAISDLQIQLNVNITGSNGDGITGTNASSLTISNVKVVAGSTMGVEGVYIRLISCDNSIVSACIFDGTNNTFDGHTGLSINDSANVTVKNCIAYNNLASGFFVLAQNANCSVTFVNCVAYNCNAAPYNTGFGGAGLGFIPTITVKNSIASSCGIGIGDIGPFVSVPVASIIDSSYNCLNNTTDYGSAATITKANDLTATNPRFVSTTSGSEDFHVQLKAIGYGFDSPCVDAGTSSGAPTTDIEGTARPQGSAFDIGAYEDKTGYHSSTSKVANKKKATVGDIVTYTVTINNSSLKSILNTQLVDATPKGFKYLNGTTTLNNVKQADPAGTTTRTFTLGTLAANTTYTLKYKLVVGSGVDFGDYTNTATLYSTSDNTLSGTAKETVTIVANPLFYTATILGKVYNDQNKNQVQDNGEEGLPDIELGLETGLRVKTDAYGRFHIENLKPQTHIIGLDTTTLPKGSKLTTPNPVLLTAVTEAIPLKANFGVWIPENKNK